MRRGAEPAKFVAIVAAVLLCVIAAIGIVAILSGPENNEEAGKVIFAAVALTILSLAAMAGAVLSVRRPALAPFGYATIVLALAAFAIVVRKIWDDGVSLFGEDWELPIIATIVALACGQVSLLLAWVRDATPLRWLASGAALAISAVAALASLTIAIDDFEVDVSVYAVLAILYLLGIALLPLFTLSAGSPETPDT